MLVCFSYSHKYKKNKAHLSNPVKILLNIDGFKKGIPRILFFIQLDTFLNTRNEK